MKNPTLYKTFQKDLHYLCLSLIQGIRLLNSGVSGSSSCTGYFKHLKKLSLIFFLSPTRIASLILPCFQHSLTRFYKPFEGIKDYLQDSLKTSTFFNKFLRTVGKVLSNRCANPLIFTSALRAPPTGYQNVNLIEKQ